MVEPYSRVCRTVDELHALAEWQHLTDDLRFWMTTAFKAYEKKAFTTDGITWISQLGFEKPPGHPAGVTHDYFYVSQIMSRYTADVIFRDILIAFGYPNYAKLYYYGVRVFGGIPWYWRRWFKKRGK